MAASYPSRDRLVIFDADGTTVDAFSAIESAFKQHTMDIGDLVRFQKRRRLLKYLGGLRELPGNLRQQLGKHRRKHVIATLTEIYRHEATLYPGIAALLKSLLATPGIKVALVTRNITNNPEETFASLLSRYDIDIRAFDAVTFLPLDEKKTAHFRKIREQFGVNPARTFACGDEYGDYVAAVACGIYPCIVAYGFEDLERLIEHFDVPKEVISRTPGELVSRLRHTLEL